MARYVVVTGERRNAHEFWSANHSERLYRDERITFELIFEEIGCEIVDLSH